MKFLNILIYELKHFLKSKSKLFAYLFFVIACCYSVYIGFSLYNSQNSNIDSLQEIENENISQVIKWFKTGEKGPKEKDWVDITDPYWSLRYTPKYVVKNPSPLMPLGLGQSEQYGYHKKITIWSSPYDNDVIEEISNYERFINGNIDFSFLIIFLLPLLTIIFTYNINGLEKDLNFDKLIAVQTRSVKHWVLGRLFFYWILLVSTVNIFIIVVFCINNVNIIEGFDLIKLSNLYVTVFFLPFYFVIMSSNSSTVIAFKMISIWLFLCVLIPGSVHQYISLKYPPNFMTDFLDANRKETYAVFKLPKEELHRQMLSIYVDLDTTKQGLDSLINRKITRNTMSCIVNQINVQAINIIEEQNNFKNNLIRSTYWFNPISYFQNKWNKLTSTDYYAYKDFRDNIQFITNKKLKILAFECWNERTVNLNLYNEYLKKLNSYNSSPNLEMITYETIK